MEDLQFEEEEIAVWGDPIWVFMQVLNGEQTIEQTREDLASFRNSKWYTGTKEEFKIIKDKNE